MDLPPLGEDLDSASARRRAAHHAPARPALLRLAAAGGAVLLRYISGAM